MFKHITQPDGETCMCTCIAMVAGKDVDRIVADYHDHLKSGDMDYHHIFKRLDMGGFAVMPHSSRLNPHVVHILTVPSLNIAGGLHAVVAYFDAELNDWTVLDPAKGFSSDRKFYVARGQQIDGNPNAVALKSWTVDYILPLSR